MTFDSLEQRLAHSYLETFPAFVPSENNVDAREQERFYDFMKQLYQLAYNQPLLWVSTLHEDDVYPNHSTKKAYGKPDLQKHMHKFMQAMDGLLQTLFDMGKGAQVKLNKRQMTILATLGHDMCAPLPPAWAWMATRPGANLPAFAHCFFHADYPYVSDLYARLLGNEPAFRRLETWMLARGYRRFVGLDVTASTDPISLTYANPAWSAETPRGGYEYKIRHTGIAAVYNIELRHPAVFGLHSRRAQAVSGRFRRYGCEGATLCSVPNQGVRLLPLLCADGQNRDTTAGLHRRDARRGNTPTVPLFPRLQL